MMREYSDNRKKLVDAIIKEFVGPGSEEVGPPPEEEVITDKPTNRYTAGMIYPQEAPAEAEDDIAGDNIVATASESDHDETIDSHINMANQFFPSAIGLSFCVKGIPYVLKVKVHGARYARVKDGDNCTVFAKGAINDLLNNPIFLEKVQYEDGKFIINAKMSKESRDILLGLSKENDCKTIIYTLYNQSNYGWKRILLSINEINISFGATDYHEKDIDEGLRLFCLKKYDKQNDRTFITISLVNMLESDIQRDNEKTYFQAGFRVMSSEKNNDVFIEYEKPMKFMSDPEIESYRLLYYHRKQFASGHGCSAGWIESGEKAREVFTESMPISEIAKLDFAVKEIEESVPEILDMKNLSDISDLKPSEIIDKLYKFCDAYKTWISGLEKEKNILPIDLQSVAARHISDCLSILTRMISGVEIMKHEKNIFRAFQLANRAMFMQRIHVKLQENKHYPNEGLVNMPDYRKSNEKCRWRPFQLAFLLMTVKSMNDPKSSERDTIDLIWFPTAGGKTEAYLGLSALTIFLRRLKHLKNSNGTAIIMRYTLRLLTSQQFQRAATLICACEIIRKEIEDELGKDDITIGLWIGGKSTPNSTTEAFSKLSKLTSYRSNENPFQILSCPWCGAKMARERGRGAWGYREAARPKRLMLFCPDKRCDFHKELPIKVIDEDMYNVPPTLLFGTVDKFALLPWKREASSFFAIDSECLSPELIIQDELHLISGPLGSIVGLYETAIDILCSTKGVKPKIIASTATIRRAVDQCAALYGRPVSQFPSKGLKIEDSFFVRELPINNDPGRLYVGVMATGKTQTTAEIRLFAAILQASYDLRCKDYIKDSYWTLVGYFNSLRELGQCVTLVNDDIKDYIRRMAMRRNIPYRVFYEPDELTSRIDATEIPKKLEKLSVKYPDKNAIDIILASNMIATGVDIARLNLMVVVGQPKTSSEYIQATSRIGRNTPGLVFTLYDGARPRDRSHFEYFSAYHQAFYKYVEPTSVTPFSGPARERALHAIIITLARHLLGINKNQDAKNLKNSPELKAIVNAIINRITEPKEKKATEEEINSILDRWISTAASYEKLCYGVLGEIDKHLSSGEISLMVPAGKKIKRGVWATLTSMRNVDAECSMHIDE